MTKLSSYTLYCDAQRHYTTQACWDLFDGTSERFNIAHECVDRHAADRARIAIRIAHADGRDELVSFRELSELSSRFAHWLTAKAIAPGDRVALMLAPSLAFYACLFGAMKCGAVVVPLFTLFGPDGVKLRVDDCKPRLLVTNAEKFQMAQAICGPGAVVASESLLPELQQYPSSFAVQTRAGDIAAYQYTSGTTRELPEAVPHSHRALVVLMNAALYGTGIRPGDEFFCPSSPAWGHGLWHGTLSPLALGVTTGTFAGKFDAVRLMQALQDYGVTNLSAAATHYRMMKATGTAHRYRYAMRKLSYTGEPIDTSTLRFVEETFRTPVCSMYGTTEVGVILVNYPGAADFKVKPGSLGKPVPGVRVQVQERDGHPCPPNQVGELKLWRRDSWIPTKDLAYVDDEGYFHHAGRADDVIISAGWTMSAVEIENVLMKHEAVIECAVIGVEDRLRGQIVKAFVVCRRSGDDELVRQLQELARTRLSHHEYPRLVEFVSELPKTPAGKINRKTLRQRELARQLETHSKRPQDVE